MPLVLGRERVLEVFRDAEKRRWVLPAFNSENLTTTEAILAAAQEHGERIGCRQLPIIVDITNTYWHRPQTMNYTHTRDWRVGLRLFLADLNALTEAGSPFADLNVLVHLDHIQWDSDAELLAGDLRQFSSIMFDASTLPIEENIRRTRKFVQQWGNDILVEGACDEICEVGEMASDKLTDPKLAEHFWRETGVDLLVANLGTEHRAGAARAQYHGDVAREITKRVGARLCLHGTSSVAAEQVARLFDDGVRRVNLWTKLERDSTAALLRAMRQNAAKLAGPQASLDFYATAWRQGIVFEEMKRIVQQYLELWYG